MTDDFKPIEDATSTLLIDLATGRFAPPEPTLSPLAGGTWACRDLSRYSGTFSVTGGDLKLDLAAPNNDLETHAELLELFATRNERADLTLVDGSAVDADFAHMRRLSARGEVDLYHWTWAGKGEPTYWIGRLHGHVPPDGNLGLIERRAATARRGHWGFRLEGYATWYVVTSATNPHTVVLTTPAGARPDRDEVRRDLACIEFVFGGPLRLDRLVGIDTGRNLVGAFSLHHLIRRGHKRRSPVPDDLNETGGRSIPDLFALIRQKMATEGPDPLSVAVAAYLDSETEHLDGGYLKAHVGLEAFAHQVLLIRSGGSIPKEGRELRVRDEVAWKEWVRTLEAEIQKHVAPDSLEPDRTKLIMDKFLDARFSTTSRMVRRAFASASITLPEDVIVEIKRRDDPAHHFLMNRRLDHDDLNGDARRLEIIQTLLAALVAIHVGYEGPLKGYDISKGGGRLPPSWWPVSPKPNEDSFQYRGASSTQPPSREGMVLRLSQSPQHEELASKLVKSGAADGIKVCVMELECGHQGPGWCTNRHILYVLEGTLLIHFDDESLELQTGDAAHLPAAEEHRRRYEPAGDRVRVLLVETV